ncbi:hypothetical protein B0H65DRAFT_257547 [Neurospora tetraspora]|uniref:Uncharacterized protein n=1 Tax=Neurospora tetraspora TaxID=94610 RepID=A0AAE0MQQ5_9PEZI|nr:hypothetical protein B0H65DRAFT_257547 [Neurospora tetraspora]
MAPSPGLTFRQVHLLKFHLDDRAGDKPTPQNPLLEPTTPRARLPVTPSFSNPSVPFSLILLCMPRRPPSHFSISCHPIFLPPLPSPTPGFRHLFFIHKRPHPSCQSQLDCHLAVNNLGLFFFALLLFDRHSSIIPSLSVLIVDRTRLLSLRAFERIPSFQILPRRLNRQTELGNRNTHQTPTRSPFFNSSVPRWRPRDRTSLSLDLHSTRPYDTHIPALDSGNLGVVYQTFIRQEPYRPSRHLPML